MTENRLALIIANSEYGNPDISQLSSPIDDAKNLAEVLGDPNIGNFKLKTLINEPKDKTEEEIETFFVDSKHEDLLLLYISCHGIVDKRGHLYFAAFNTKPKLLQSTAISDRFLDSIMHSSRSRQQILLLDCCYSGAFARGLTVKGDNNVGLGERFKAEGRIILTSSNSWQCSYEGDKINGTDVGSIFTTTIVDGLKTGKADTNRDGKIYVDELYEYIRGKFELKSLQEPQIISFGAPGNILLAKNPNFQKRNASHKLEFSQKRDVYPEMGFSSGIKTKEIYILHSSNDDIIIHGENIENVLNKMVYQESTKILRFIFIKKFEDIKRAQYFLDRYHYISIFLVNINQTLDNIGYWELGYAKNLNMRIIGYKDSKNETKIPDDVINTLLIVSDYDELLRQINIAVESLIYRNDSQIWSEWSN